ncbi:hypothetical protein [Microcystis sp. M169S2]|uniref:hypothetical protein n=1 Tax=Microcystis sp. M169S2 TaxID=2771157 RepID=UPI00258F7CDE|nr:hypothetical protein [Microcystis sp. M169S2]MCA2716589.1 hypothetical protein [Microcystis sp. M169S2]
MRASLIKGVIKFSLIVLDENKLNDVEETLASISSEEILDFLPTGIIVKDFELNQESREVSVNVSEATS